MLSREYNPCSWLLLHVVRSLPRNLMCFLNSSSVLADPSFVDSFPHSNCLGHKYSIERPPFQKSYFYSTKYNYLLGRVTGLKLTQILCSGLGCSRAG